MVTADAILGVATLAGFGALGWALQLSERITVVEVEYEGLKALINEKFDGVNGRLDRIEEKL